MTTVYKIINNCANSLISPFVHRKNITIEYKIGEFVQPHIQGSYIYAFKTLEDAKRFYRSEFIMWSWEFGPRIFLSEAEVVDIEPKIMEGLWLSPNLEADMIEFWSSPKTNLIAGYAPEGTILCSKLKLIEQVCL